MTRSRPLDPFAAAGLLAAYVALSSVLGLAGFFILPWTGGGLHAAVGFTWWVWSASLLADAVFVAGSALAAVAAYRLARDRGALVSVAAALALNWLVYTASFLLLPPGEFVNNDPLHDLVTETGELLWFVGAWGAPGLAFATAAPALAWRVRGGAAGAEAPSSAPKAEL